MIDAIVYVSNAGHTKRYAEMLGKKINIQVYDLKTAKKILKKHSNVIFMSWVKKGKLQDLKKARSKFNLNAIVAVGMSGPGKEITSALQNKNKINALKEKFFYMQGGLEIDKLKGGNLMMMTAIERSLSKVSETRSLPQSQKEMLYMLKNPKDNVRENNIKEIYSWYNKEMKKNKN